MIWKDGLCEKLNTQEGMVKLCFSECEPDKVDIWQSSIIL